MVDKKEAIKIKLNLRQTNKPLPIESQSKHKINIFAILQVTHIEAVDNYAVPVALVHSEENYKRESCLNHRMLYENTQFYSLFL